MNYGLFLTYMGFVMCMYAMHGIYKAVYAGKNKRFVKYFTMDHFFDLCLFILWLTFIIATYAGDLHGTWIDRPGFLYKWDGFIVNFVNDDTTNGGVDEIGIIISCMIVVWVKSFYSIRFNAFLGPMYGVVFRMLQDLVSYIILLMSFLLLFALIASVLFWDLPNFDSF